MFDIQGRPILEPLKDFENVYLLYFDASHTVDEVVADLRTRDDYVIFAHPNYRARDTGCPTIPVSIGETLYHQTATHTGSWGMSNPGLFSEIVGADSVQALLDTDINLQEAWSIYNTATKKVAVLDRGIDMCHEDLPVDAVLSKCFSGNSCSTDETDPQRAHGTAVAGIIAAIANNGVGVAGVLGHPSSDDDLIVSLQLRSADGSGQTAHAATAISYAVGTGVIPVTNISMTFAGVHVDALKLAMKNAFLSGMTFAVSGGNSSSDVSPQEWGRFGIGTTGINTDGSDPGWREGPWIDVTAPGPAGAPLGVQQGVYTTAWVSFNQDCKRYGWFHATSSAAPHVAGMAALILSHVPIATNEDLLEVITRTARDLGPTGYDETWGHGLARLDNALCFVTERTLVHGDVSGAYDQLTFVEDRTQTFLNLKESWGGEGDYWVDVYKATKSVGFPSNVEDCPINTTQVWARGRQCSGWRNESTIDVALDTTWGGVVNETITPFGCDISTYFYEVFADENASSSLGWFPYDPDDGSSPPLSWGYTYLVLPSCPQRIGGNAIENLQAPTVTTIVQVYDVAGRRVREWDMEGPTSASSIEWDGRLDTGRLAPTGVYFVRARNAVGAAAMSQRVLVVR